MATDAHADAHKLDMMSPRPASGDLSGQGRVQRTASVKHRLGLHARPAADFVRLANTFASDIRVKRGRRVVNGKSIMGVLTLAAAAGSRLTVEAEGPDASDAVHALTRFLLSGDDEPLKGR